MRFKTAINVELQWSKNTGGTTERFLVQTTGSVFFYFFPFFSFGEGGEEVVGGTDREAAGHVSFCAFRPPR